MENESVTVLSSAALQGAITLSTNSLAVSQDGQLAIITRTEINILTPSQTIQSTSDSVWDQGKKEPKKPIPGMSTKGKEKAGAELPLLRTVIEMEKKEAINWGGWRTDDLDNISNFSDPYWCACTWSPSGLNTLGGCIFVALTTNHEVLVFEPMNDPFGGEWKETFDLTSTLVDLLLVSENLASGEDSDNESTPEMPRIQRARRAALKILECQATTVCWSHPVTEAHTDFSLLVVGHKSGHISLWRRTNDSRMEILHRYRMSGSPGWINKMSWSSWRVQTKGSQKVAIAYLAVSDSDGNVWSVEIEQDISGPRHATAHDAMDVDSEATGVAAAEPVLLADPDLRPASEFCWVEKENQLQLVYAKLGTVNVVSLKTSDAGLSKVKNTELELPLVGASRWVGATPLATCCSIEFVRNSHTAIVSLASSAIYAVSLGEKPAFATTSATVPDSDSLTYNARQVYRRVTPRLRYTSSKTEDSEPLALTKLVGAQFWGFESFGADGEFGWVYESVFPDALRYKMQSASKLYLAMCTLFKTLESKDHIARLQSLLANPPTASLTAPIKTLMAFLHFLSSNAADSTFIRSLLPLLSQENPTPADSASEDQSPLEDQADVVPAMMESLFGESVIESLRLRELVARFAISLPTLNTDLRHDVEVAQALLSREIVKRVTSRLGAILHRAEHLLSTEDLSVSGRILLASTSLQLDFPSQSPDQAIHSPDALHMSFESSDKCPACRASIKMASVRHARCDNAHEWDRCSITLSVVSTINVRTCTGCGRKALVGMTRGVTTDDGAVVESILKAATCCMHCGGRWRR